MKYKLVKKYPGSPNIGDTAELDIELGDFRVSSNYFQPIPEKQIINYPEFWEEVKEPLFVTEDGVAKYFGDDYYYVVEADVRILPFAWASLSHKVDWKCTKTVPLGRKQFHSLEDCEKYISENKPKFSVKDIEEALLFAKEEKHSVIEDEGFIILSKFNEKKFKEKLGI